MRVKDEEVLGKAVNALFKSRNTSLRWPGKAARLIEALDLSALHKDTVPLAQSPFTTVDRGSPLARDDTVQSAILKYGSST